ncbi:chain-length determining protein [Aliidongia dinghuensis]|uniref:Chain-length determining protein n=1 Tax=Aliidongia dinghuensis TaxID=1867774 RepID=A0A8J2YPD2_9PROT|nr:polysaccharide biosynthesis tyrosine autokinase [Aliidongia dinghuensis]GGE99197.1 chain-length determining protein [Aliidongia dinghuensis]
MTDATSGSGLPSAPIYRRGALIEHPALDSFAPPAIETTTILGMGALLWRRRWVICATALAAMAVTVLVAKQLTPKYTADGAVVVATRKMSIPELETLVTPTGDQALVRSEMAVMSSRQVLNAVADKLHLDQVPEFNPTLKPEDDSLLARLNPIPFIQGLMRGPQKQVGDPQAAIHEGVLYTLTKNLDLVNDGRDYVISITYKSETPEISAQVVNTLIRTYLDQYVSENRAATIEANQSLDVRGEELRKQMLESEQKVQDFTNKTGLLVTPQGTVAGQQVAELNGQLATARADRAAAEAQYNQAIAAKQGGVAANSNVLASPVIQALRAQEAEAARNQSDLRSRVGPNHPDLKAANQQVAGLQSAINREIDKVVSSLRGQVDVTRARESSLVQQIATLNAKATASSAAQDQLQRLNDDAQSKRKVYDEFMLRVAQTAKPQDIQQANARMISSAEVPLHPSSPKITLMALLAAFAGSLIAIAGSILYAQLDHGFESLEQVRTVTGLPGLAALPMVRNLGRKRLPHRYVVDNPTSPVAETLRAFRAKLRWASEGRSLKTILVSSAVPGEGKTSFALSFARLAARDGCRVLLVECDFRRPTLETVLPPPSRPGQPSFLDDPAGWRDWVGVDDLTGLNYLTATEDTDRLAPMLESDGLGAVLRDARREYDYIVIDSPPVMRVPDAMLLARSVDAVALIVSWKRTRQRLVREALRRLALDPDMPTGIILTKVEKATGQDVYSGYSR